MYRSEQCKKLFIFYKQKLIRCKYGITTLQGLSESHFYHLTGNAAIALAKQIVDMAKLNESDLKLNGISDRDIATMEKTIEGFRAVIAKPMDAISERKQKTTNITQLFAELDSILYGKLDKYMVIFKETNTDFYNEYRTSRNLILTSIRHKDNGKQLGETGEAGEMEKIGN